MKEYITHNVGQDHLVGDFYDSIGGEWEAYIYISELGFEDSSIQFTYEGEIIYEKDISDFVTMDDSMQDLEAEVSIFIQEEHITGEEDNEWEDLGNIYQY